MAPLPPNNTAVYEVFYTTSSEQHSTQVRTDAVSPAAFGTFFDSIMDALSPNLFSLVIDEVTFRPALSTISNPVTTGIEGNTYGSLVASTLEKPQYLSFVGRSSGGRRNRMTFFGLTDLGTNFRVSAGEFASVDAVTAILNGATGIGIAIDGLETIWKSYANAGVNSYWQRKLRA